MQPKIHARVQLNTRLLPAMVVLLVVLQLTVPYQGWVALLVGFGGAWLIGYLWARSLARGLSLVREMRFGWAQVGDRLEERFTLINRGWAPALWVEVIDHSTLPGYQVSEATGVGGDSENRWIVHGTCTRRGAFTLGPTMLRTGDPFGLFTVTLDHPASTNMMVLPPIVPLPNIEVAPGGRAGEGRRRAGSFERTVNAASVREYRPGDSLNSIHWRTSARLDSLFVRLFDNTPSGDWWIFLDLNQRVQVGQGQDSTIEHGVILAASLAAHGLRAGRAVGFVVCGDGLTWLPPQSSEAQRWEILRALALVQPGTRSIAELLKQGQAAFKQMSSLIIITPDLRGDWIKSLVPFLWRGGVPTALLFDPVSFGGAGDVRPVLALLADLEIARYVVTRDLLDRPEAKPGKQGRWEWRITLRGRAVPVRPHGDARWKVLS